MRVKDELRRLEICLSERAFTDACVESFNANFRHTDTLDMVLLHPHKALRFCKDTAAFSRWLDHHLYERVSGDSLYSLILRVLMNRRKNPKDDGRPLLWHTKARKTPKAKQTRTPGKNARKR